MEALLTSITLVALAEIGDKTQLLSFVLAAKLRRPYAIMAGILVATLANHALAGSVGVWLARLVVPSTLDWIVGVAFITFGLWTLRPDTLEGDPRLLGAGAFVTTTVAFFLAEMGDKTQLATVALAARYDALAWVVLGTTLGMMVANVPAVIVGEALAHRLPMRAVRWVAAALFVAVGLATLIGAQQVTRAGPDRGQPAPRRSSRVSYQLPEGTAERCVAARSHFPSDFTYTMRTRMRFDWSGPSFGLIVSRWYPQTSPVLPITRYWRLIPTVFRLSRGSPSEADARDAFAMSWGNRSVGVKRAS